MKILLKEIWNKAKKYIKKKKIFNKEIYSAYIKNTILIKIKKKKAIILVENYLQKIILKEEIKKLNKILKKILKNNEIKCLFFLKKEYYNKYKKKNNILKNEIKKNMNFENFIVGPSNKESYIAAKSSIQRIGKYYNPLFIYGNSGLGKTHLLNAIANYINKKNKKIVYHYTTCSEFVRKVINSIKKKIIEKFKKKMHKLDILLIDDIQFLSGKEKSHEIFFNIFNKLIHNKKQVVITCDRLPNEIKGFEKRLISRFNSGLSVNIKSPKFKTSLEILKIKIKQKSYDLSLFEEKVLVYIAKNFSKDIRMLEGALNRILFYSIEFSKKNYIDFKTALKAFESINNNSISIKNLNIKSIKKIVSDYYGISILQLISKSRNKNISLPRQIAIFLCRKYLDLSYSKIGEEFGNRDHSTIISSNKKIKNKILKDKILMKVIIEIEKKINKK